MSKIVGSPRSATRGDICQACGATRILVDKVNGVKWCPYVKCDYSRKLARRKKK